MEISVIIPVYNSEDTIRDCFFSVYDSLKLDAFSFEIILVNDGSTDSSLDEIKRLCGECPKEVVVIDQVNAGASVARNAGLNKARGRFIAFNDSDDVWEIGGISERLAILQKYKFVDCVAANHDIEKQRLWFLRRVSEDLYEISFNAQMFKCYFSPPTTIMRRSIIDSGFRFNPNLTHAEEGYFFNHVLARHTCYFLNSKVSTSITRKKRFGESGLSGNLKEMQRGELFNLKNAYETLHFNRLLYFTSVSFSLFKYFRRIFIVLIRSMI